MADICSRSWCVRPVRGRSFSREKLSVDCKTSYSLTDGAPSVSEYEVLQSTDSFSLLKLLPRTGRTHQLRLHMSAIGHPLAGDWLYGTEDTDLIPRAALHSCRVHLKHPVTGEILDLICPLPDDMTRLMTL